MKEQPPYWHTRSTAALIFFLIASLPLQAKTDTTAITVDTLKKELHYSFSDTTAVVHKKFSAEEIKKLKSDTDLIYNHPPTVAENLWVRFKRWISEWIFNLFTGALNTNLGQILVYLIGGALVIFLIMSLLKVNAFSFFMKGGDVAPSYQVLHENIHEMDFEKLISEATSENDYRLATRLVFLYALKILSDRQLIDWNPGKTNHDYVEEVNHPELKNGLMDLSFYFDYAWYGNFKVTSEVFSKVKDTFYTWKTKAEE
ncbi:MAG: DUF4129 domain-containing protein [Bacteroidetes bacterium]|nr:DUF4129 domain-containing protein [Bacteroidota bacterium]MBS1540602.1 DUF4129 domain-containing protein [Bacteroidota bacterium]